MENLNLNKTQKSPLVILNKDSHFFKFSGSSTLNDASEFYNPIIHWLDRYKKLMNFFSIYNTDTYQLSIDFELNYYNSVSKKYIYEIMKIIKEISILKNIKININWICEQENLDMLETGVQYKDLFQIPINFILSENRYSEIKNK